MSIFPGSSAAMICSSTGANETVTCPASTGTGGTAGRRTAWPRRFSWGKRMKKGEDVEFGLWELRVDGFLWIFMDFYGWYIYIWILMIFGDFDGKSEKIFGDFDDDWWWFIRIFMDLLGFIVMWICGFLEDDLYGFRMNCGTPRFTCETFSLVPYDIWIYMDYSDVKSVNICNIHI